MTRLSLLILLFVAPLMVLGQGVGPQMRFDQTEIDICDIWAGEIAEFKFTFRNTGDADLVIQFAKTSTGAAVADWPQEPIKPGDSGMIRVRFLTQGKVGQSQKQVTVGCNDSLQSPISLTYKCFVVPRPSDPTFFASGAQQQTPPSEYPLPSTCLSFAKPCKEGLRIALGSREPLVFYYDVIGNGKPTELKQLHRSGEVMSVDWTAGPQLSGNQDSVLVWFDTQTLGPFSNSVIIETTSEARPLLYLHFEGRIVREDPLTLDEGR